MARAKGEPDDPSLVRRIRAVRLVAFDFDGVFTDNAVYVFEDGREAVRCSRGDGIGLRRLEETGVEPVIISMESNPVVAMRGRKLKVKCFTGCDDKLEVLEGILKERGLSMAQAAFVGNDINDLACLGRVGLPIVVRDAHPDVVYHALYQTRDAGGHGAVREVCDLIARCRGQAST